MSEPFTGSTASDLRRRVDLLDLDDEDDEEFEDEEELIASMYDEESRLEKELEEIRHQKLLAAENLRRALLKADQEKVRSPVGSPPVSVRQSSAARQQQAAVNNAAPRAGAAGASGKRSVSAAAQKPLTVNEFAWAKKFQEAARQGYEGQVDEVDEAAVAAEAAEEAAKDQAATAKRRQEAMAQSAAAAKASSVALSASDASSEPQQSTASAVEPQQQRKQPKKIDFNTYAQRGAKKFGGEAGEVDEVEVPTKELPQQQQNSAAAVVKTDSKDLNSKYAERASQKFGSEVTATAVVAVEPPEVETEEEKRRKLQIGAAAKKAEAHLAKRQVEKKKAQEEKAAAQKLQDEKDARAAREAEAAAKAAQAAQAQAAQQQAALLHPATATTATSAASASAATAAAASASATGASAVVGKQVLSAAVVGVPAAAHVSPESLATQSAKLRQLAIEIIQLESQSTTALTLMMKEAGLQQLDTKWQQAADAERIKLATEAKIWQAASESLRHKIELEAQKFEAAVVTGAVPETSEAASAAILAEKAAVVAEGERLQLASSEIGQLAQVGATIGMLKLGNKAAASPIPLGGPSRGGAVGRIRSASSRHGASKKHQQARILHELGRFDEAMALVRGSGRAQLDKELQREANGGGASEFTFKTFNVENLYQARILHAQGRFDEAVSTISPARANTPCTSLDC